MSSQVITFQVDGFDNLLHILVDDSSRQALVVDPAWDADEIVNQLAAVNATPVGVLLTHSHADHVSALPALLQRYPDLPVYISREEYDVGRITLDNPRFIGDGEQITLGDTWIDVLATPGHTAGGVSYYTQQSLIVGDTLFIDGCGRCDFADSDVNKLFDSLQRIKQLPDDLRIYCGHDYGQQPSATLGEQKQTNPYLLMDDREFFVAFRMQLQSQYRQIPFAPSSLSEMQTIQKSHGFA